MWGDYDRSWSIARAVRPINGRPLFRVPGSETKGRER